MPMTLFYCKKDLILLMHGQTFGNCLFFLQKCTILHLGRNNTLHNYSVNNASIPDVTEVTDLCVLVDKNCDLQNKFTNRSNVNKANHRSSLILKSFQSWNSHCYLELLLFLCVPCWTIGLDGRLFIKLISILFNVYNVVSLNVFLVLFKITHNLVAL